jgi:hypothetical protein
VAAGNEQTIEVEVVEIDGIAVKPRPTDGETRREGTRVDWSHWQGRVKRLDARWWPLWLVLGFFAIIVAVVVGICLGLVFVVWRIFKAILKGIANVFIPPSGKSSAGGGR